MAKSKLLKRSSNNLKRASFTIPGMNGLTDNLFCLEHLGHIMRIFVSVTDSY